MSRTKSIVVKNTVSNIKKICAMPVYSDSPLWHFILFDWIEEPTHEIAITDPLDYINDSDLREVEANNLCKELECIGITYYRVITTISEYKSKEDSSD